MKIVSIIERAISHSREYGKFIVVNKTTTEFDSLVKAFIIYYYLEEEASLWDITEGRELLEKKILLKCK
jgi:hypothetical protein